jgi:hypothetical protein
MPGTDAAAPLCGGGESAQLAQDTDTVDPDHRKLNNVK